MVSFQPAQAVNSLDRSDGVLDRDSFVLKFKVLALSLRSVFAILAALMPVIEILAENFKRIEAAEELPEARRRQPHAGDDEWIARSS